jgi:hypothetical protein
MVAIVEKMGGKGGNLILDGSMCEPLESTSPGLSHLHACSILIGRCESNLPFCVMLLEIFLSLIPKHAQ